MMITVQLDKAQAEAQLTFLRLVGPQELAAVHKGIEWATFDKGCTALRVALRDAVEPGWVEKEFEP
jgi:hypothetical protein